MSKLISIDGKIFLYKGEQKEYPNDAAYGNPGRNIADGQNPDENWDVDGFLKAKAAFERDCVLCEDQEAALELIRKMISEDSGPESYVNTFQPKPNRLYSVSVEMESVEQYRLKETSKWRVNNYPQYNLHNYEYRTIARIKKRMI